VHVSTQEFEDVGPIDYAVLEWPTDIPGAGSEVAPLLVDLVDRGIIRIYDIAFMAKADDGTVTAVDFAELGPDSGFTEFEGASSGLIGEDDIREAAEALEPGRSAAVLVWENRWAAPVAAALRRSGGQLVASGRISIQAILAALDAVEVDAVH
jgi:hypothetical protein